MHVQNLPTRMRPRTAKAAPRPDTFERSIVCNAVVTELDFDRIGDAEYILPGLTIAMTNDAPGDLTRDDVALAVTCCRTRPGMEG